MYWQRVPGGERRYQRQAHRPRVLNDRGDPLSPTGLDWTNNAPANTVADLALPTSCWFPVASLLGMPFSLSS